MYRPTIQIQGLDKWVVFFPEYSSGEPKVYFDRYTNGVYFKCPLFSIMWTKIQEGNK